MDLVQRAAGKVTDMKGRSALADADEEDALLELPLGNAPLTVFVSLMKTPDGMSPCFRLTPDGPYATQGIWWRFSLDDELAYARFITLKLSPEIGEVECDTLWSSAVHDQTQQLCIPPGKAVYSFSIDLPNGGRVDPQIVVTPITNVDS